MSAKLIEHVRMRELTLEASAAITNNERRALGNDGLLFGTRPRISLGEPRPVASGLSIAVAALASGDGSIAEDGTRNVLVYAEEPVAGATFDTQTNQPVESRRARLLATIACTFGATTESVWVGDGQTGSAVTVRWAENMVITLDAYGTALLDTAYGAAPAAFNPGSDGIARAVFPQLPGMTGLIFDGATAASLYLDALRVA